MLELMPGPSAHSIIETHSEIVSALGFIARAQAPHPLSQSHALELPQAPVSPPVPRMNDRRHESLQVCRIRQVDIISRARHALHAIRRSSKYAAYPYRQFTLLAFMLERYIEGELPVDTSDRSRRCSQPHHSSREAESLGASSGTHRTSASTSVTQSINRKCTETSKNHSTHWTMSGS
jgi:hypothetical protein